MCSYARSDLSQVEVYVGPVANSCGTISGLIHLTRGSSICVSVSLSGPVGFHLLKCFFLLNIYFPYWL